jgi:hypothetical protein
MYTTSGIVMALWKIAQFATTVGIAIAELGLTSPLMIGLIQGSPVPALDLPFVHLVEDDLI